MKGQRQSRKFIPAHDIASINSARHAAGLPLLQVRTNTCKRCHEAFQAYDKWSFCPSCRSHVTHMQRGVLDDFPERAR